MHECTVHAAYSIAFGRWPRWPHSAVASRGRRTRTRGGEGEAAGKAGAVSTEAAGEDGGEQAEAEGEQRLEGAAARGGSGRGGVSNCLPHFSLCR